MRIEDKIRDVLKERQHFMVHFNTNMAKEPNYPDDLRLAARNPSWMMCSSSVGATTHHPEYDRQQTMGEVGLIMDIGATTTLHRISHVDAGSMGRLNAAGAGPDASIEAALAAIDREQGHDEWVHTNAVPRGIFAFGGFNVWNNLPDIGNLPSQAIPPVVAADFPEMEVFSICKGHFQRWDRSKQTFAPCSYSDIIP